MTGSYSDGDYCTCPGCDASGCHGTATYGCGNRLSDKLVDRQAHLPDEEKRCRICSCEHGLPPKACDECNQITRPCTGDQDDTGSLQARSKSLDECTRAIEHLFETVARLDREVFQLRWIMNANDMSGRQWHRNDNGNGGSMWESRWRHRSRYDNGSGDNMWESNVLLL